MTPSLFFCFLVFSRLLLLSGGLLWFHREREDCCFYFQKRYHWNCIGNWVESIVSSGLYGHLKILILPVCEPEISFHSLVSLSISFISVLVFKVQVVSLFVKFIPNYFILSDASINRIVSLIPFSNNLLLMYRNSTDFCVLILCPISLLNLFIQTVFWWCLLGFLYIMSSANRPFYFFLFDLDTSSLYLASLLWLGFLVLCWRKVVGVNIVVLFLIL